MKRLVLSLIVVSSSVLLFAACSSTDGTASSSSSGSSGSEDGGPGGPSPGSARSGTRLAIVRYQAPGDAYAFPKLRDTELGPCIPLQTVDDAVRCVPASRAGFGYADASCTQPVAVDTGGCAPRYAVTNEPAKFDTKTCDLDITMRMRVFEVGAPSSATTVYFDDGTGCKPSALPRGAKVFTATELAPSRMVALDAKDEAIGRVAVRVVTSDDGLRLPVGLVDASSAKTCTFVRTSDGRTPTLGEAGTLTCVPGLGATSGGGDQEWSDPQCTTPAAVLRDPCGRLPSFVQVFERASGACSPQKLHAVGAQLPTSFVGAPGACSPVSVDPGDPRTLWAVGEPLGLGSFATLQRTLVGTAQLRSTAYVVEGQTVLDGFAPSLLRGDDPCRPVSVGGVTYCLSAGVPMIPESTMGTPYPFSDAACTKPAVATFSPCMSKPSVVAVLRAPDTCAELPVVTHLYDVGAPATDLYSIIDGVCQPMPAPGGAYFGLGTERNAADVLVRLESKEL